MGSIKMTQSTFFQKYFSYEGRLRRSQYWLYHLAQLLAACVVIGILYGIVFAAGESLAVLIAVSVLGIAFYIAYIWSALSVSVRRCHDRDRSGWFVLIGLIPLIGGIWLLIELGFLDGTQGANQFGPSPKGIGTDHIPDIFA